MGEGEGEGEGETVGEGEGCAEEEVKDEEEEEEDCALWPLEATLTPKPTARPVEKRDEKGGRETRSGGEG